MEEIKRQQPAQDVSSLYRALSTTLDDIREISLLGGSTRTITCAIVLEEDLRDLLEECRTSPVVGISGQEPSSLTTRGLTVIEEAQKLLLLHARSDAGSKTGSLPSLWTFPN